MALGEIDDASVFGDLPEDLVSHFRATFDSIKVTGVSIKGANGYLVFGDELITKLSRGNCEPNNSPCTTRQPCRRAS